MYRDEGVSAHSDRVDKRPGLVQLLADADHGTFDIVLVHTLDRWARNLRVALTALASLNAANGIPPFGYALCACPDRLSKLH